MLRMWRRVNNAYKYFEDLDLAVIDSWIDGLAVAKLFGLFSRDRYN